MPFPSDGDLPLKPPVSRQKWIPRAVTIVVCVYVACARFEGGLMILLPLPTI